jgi:hypothetical protein
MRNRSGHDADAASRSGSDAARRPRTSCGSTVVDARAPAGRPRRARAPSGVTSTPTPAWFPSWRIIAGPTCNPLSTPANEPVEPVAPGIAASSIGSRRLTMKVRNRDGSPRWMPGANPSSRYAMYRSTYGRSGGAGSLLTASTVWSGISPTIPVVLAPRLLGALLQARADLGPGVHDGVAPRLERLGGEIARRRRSVGEDLDRHGEVDSREHLEVRAPR